MQGGADALAPTASWSAAAPPSVAQGALLALIAGELAFGLAFDLGRTGTVLHWAAWVGFAAGVGWRALATLLARPPPAAADLPDQALPTYTVIVPLYREANMARSLLRALGALDYPRDRLQVLLALEADDGETRAACDALALPGFVEVLLVPPGEPRTKPRACNAALSVARGALTVVYDAEDRPHPGQLREAAARFANGELRLGCLQAPLRIRVRQDMWLQRQFALEYAALFEVWLPALARLGFPFPLGGTSNHFRTQILRHVGGWDPWNVTEDADIGFRLAAEGYQLGVLRRPTYEPPPLNLAEWGPQRSRWLKGYMQTWGVHTRRPWPARIGVVIALQLTVGLTIASAALNGWILLWLALVSLGMLGPSPALGALDVSLPLAAWLVAAAAIVRGSRRERAPLSPFDLLSAPVYWLLQSFAFPQALWQLLVDPFRWDKTPHHPPDTEDAAGAARLDGGRPWRVRPRR